MKYQIINGDNRAVLKTFPDNHFDSIVTDPPYGIDFLGKSWDANTGALETYQECLRVLKPGGHILAFSAARTYHHLAITLEQAGFEIRDQIMWIYSSGFPKSQDVGKSIERSEGKKHKNNEYRNENQNKDNDSAELKKHHANLNEVQRCVLCKSSTGPIHKKCDRTDCPKPWIKEKANNEWNGWGTALKPAHEPIALARKPIKLSIAKNCQTHGVGALNIDATRIEWDDEAQERIKISNANGGIKIGKGIEKYGTIGEDGDKTEERALLNEQGRFPSNVLGEIPDYQKYFYCPKVSRRERHIGFDDPGAMFPGSRFDVYMPTAGKTNPDTKIEAVEEKLKDKGNNHPTVKPIELMKYLIKLVTPKGGRVLDPFNGSGSTGCAAVELGCEYVGIELDPKYVEIATKRIEAWNKEETSFKELFS